VLKETNSDSQAPFPGSLFTHIGLFIQIKRRVKKKSRRFVSAVTASCYGFLLTHFIYIKRPTHVKRDPENGTHSLGRFSDSRAPCIATEWRGYIECLIFVGHFYAKEPYTQWLFCGGRPAI